MANDRKLKGYALIIVTFLLGVATGGGVSYASMQHHIARMFRDRPELENRRLGALARRLDLDESQRDRVHAVMERYGADRRALTRDMFERCGEKLKAAQDALEATAPDAKIVAEEILSDRQTAQTDVGNALQGHPDLNAVFGGNDEGSLGALGAFAAAGKELPCLTENGGNDEVLQAVKDGKIYASAALQFADDMTQSFDELANLMQDPTKDGQQIQVPMKVIKAEG